MPYQGIKVEGGRQLRATLRKAATEVTDLKDAHREAGTIVAQAAKPAAPHRSGRLAGSVRPGATKTAAIIRAGNARAVPYAGPIHWGWPRRHINPQPWITDTAQATEPIWTAAYAAAVQTVLNTIRGASR